MFLNDYDKTLWDINCTSKTTNKKHEKQYKNIRSILQKKEYNERKETELCAAQRYDKTLWDLRKRKYEKKCKKVENKYKNITSNCIMNEYNV